MSFSKADLEAYEREVILADDQRQLQAGWVAVCEVGREPCPELDYKRWLIWYSDWLKRAKRAFIRLN